MKETDPLLSCLLHLCKIFCKKESLLHTQLEYTNPKQGLSVEDFIVNAKKLDIEAKVKKVAFSNLHEQKTPLVLILKNNQAEIISGFNANNEPIYANTTNREKHKPIKSNYSGYCIELTENVFFDARSSLFEKKQTKNWFFSLLPKLKKMYMSIFLATFLSNIFVFVTPLFIMYVYDTVVPNNATITLWTLFIGASTLFLFDFISRMIRGYLLDMAGYRTDQILGHKLLRHTLNLKMIYKPLSIGSYLNNFQDIQSIRSFYTSSIVLGVVDFPFIFLYLFGIWYISGPLVFVPIIAILLVLVMSFLLELPAKKNMEDAIAEGNQKQGILVEALTGLETLKTLGAERSVIQNWQKTERTAEKTLSFNRYINNLSVNLTWFLYQMANISVVAAGVYLIGSGYLTVGALVAATILTSRTMMVSQISSLLFKIQRTKKAFENMGQLMSTPVERPKNKTFFYNDSLKGSVELNKISFKYPNQSYNALNDISLMVKPGEHIGIIGKNGSGKSTLLKTIVNLYTPTHGQVLLDDVDVREFDPLVLRKYVHFMSDNAALFYGSLKDNIVMANPEATDEEIQFAVKLSTTFKFISNHSLGYDMPVGERGELLSSGQKQAITLARAIISQADVLLLDEPTANLDLASEDEFIHYFKKFITDKTVLLVSHRLPILKLVDKIVVLDNGRIVACGTREEILAKMGQNMDK